MRRSASRPGLCPAIDGLDPARDNPIAAGLLAIACLLVLSGVIVLAHRNRALLKDLASGFGDSTFENLVTHVSTEGREILKTWTRRNRAHRTRENR